MAASYQFALDGDAGAARAPGRPGVPDGQAAGRRRPGRGHLLLDRRRRPARGRGRRSSWSRTARTADGHWLHEFISLSPGDVRRRSAAASRAGRPPSRASTFQPVPGAPKPAGDPAPAAPADAGPGRGVPGRRQLQGQGLVGAPAPDRRRSPATASPASSVRGRRPCSPSSTGTDPEAFLFLEARAGHDGPEWQYAFAPMTCYAAEGRRTRGRPSGTIPYRKDAVRPLEALLRHGRVSSTAPCEPPRRTRTRSPTPDRDPAAMTIDDRTPDARRLARRARRPDGRQGRREPGLHEGVGGVLPVRPRRRPRRAAPAPGRAGRSGWASRSADDVLDGAIFFWSTSRPARGRRAGLPGQERGRPERPLAPRVHLALARDLRRRPRRASRAGRPGRRASSSGPSPAPRSRPTTPAQRLRQMRALAQDFHAADNFKDKGWSELRLLPTPIARYGKAGVGASTTAPCSPSSWDRPRGLPLPRGPPGRRRPRMAIRLRPDDLLRAQGRRTRARPSGSSPTSSDADDPSEALLRPARSTLTRPRTRERPAPMDTPTNPEDGPTPGALERGRRHRRPAPRRPDSASRRRWPGWSSARSQVIDHLLVGPALPGPRPAAGRARAWARP